MWERKREEEVTFFTQCQERRALKIITSTKEKSPAEMFEWGRRFVYTGCSQNLSSVRTVPKSSIGIELTRQ